MSDAKDARDDDGALDAYPPEIAALLEDARPLEQAPAAARAAVKAKVLATVGATAAAGAAPVTAAAPAPAPVAAWWIIAALAGGVIVAALALRARPTDSRRADALGSIAAVADARALTQSAIEAPPIRAVSEREDGAVSASASEDSAVRAAPELRAVARPASAEDSLADEQRLLDQARAALSAQDPGRAMSALSTHARRYARGVLAMEREALRVRALLAEDRRDEARAAAERFVARWPSSALRSAVEAMVR